MTLKMASQEGSGDNGSEDKGGSVPSDSAPPRPTLWSYVSQDVMSTALFTLRMGTIISSFIYIISTIGLFGQIVYSAYLNAMMTAFLTFAFRLYRRKNDGQISFFSREMLVLLGSEDSGHYILYTLFFYNQLPASIYLLPPLLYAIIFTHTYTEGMKQYLPLTLQSLLSRINQRISAGQRDAFRFIAYTEIFIFLVVLWSVIAGHMFFLAPLLYYHFLKNRYSSRRNPYVRNCFAELKFAAQQLSVHPRCPSFISSLLTGIVSFVSRLAPVEQIPRQA